MSSRARLVAFGAAIVVLAGCSEATGPGLPGIEVTVSLSNADVAVGDTIEISVVATNTTADEVTFVTNSCVLVVRILDQSDTRVDGLPTGCNDIGLSHTLSPGESLMRVVLYGVPTLESGTYRVFGGVSQDFLNPSDPVELRIQQ